MLFVSQGRRPCFCNHAINPTRSNPTDQNEEGLAGAVAVWYVDRGKEAINQKKKKERKKERKKKRYFPFPIPKIILGLRRLRGCFSFLFSVFPVLQVHSRIHMVLDVFTPATSSATAAVFSRHIRGESPVAAPPQRYPRKPLFRLMPYMHLYASMQELRQRPKILIAEMDLRVWACGVMGRLYIWFYI